MRLTLIALTTLLACDAYLPEKTKTHLAVKTDVKFIQCQVCEEMIKKIHRDTKELRESLPEKKKVRELNGIVKHTPKVTEADILDKIEKMCDPETEAGYWIARYDLLEDGDKLKLVDMNTTGHCDAECLTVAKACEKVLGDSDTDLAELVYKGEAKRAQLANFLCREESGACIKKPPRLPAGRKLGPAFREKSEKEIDMDRMLQSMQGIEGMPGMQMYGRDELMESLNNEMHEENEEDRMAGGTEGLGREYAYEKEEGERNRGSGQEFAEAESLESGVKGLANTVSEGLKSAWEGVTSLFDGEKKAGESKQGEL